jgi:dihydropteroate synthase
MGVVNVTPDSFSDGGRFLDPQAAVVHGRRLMHGRRRSRKSWIVSSLY